jgi:hypothetical protein
MGDFMPLKKQEDLMWGETIFDDLDRDEMLLMLRKMFSAIQSARSVLSMAKHCDRGGAYWTEGVGGNALSKADSILNEVLPNDETGGEKSSRCFFRYSDALLFPELAGNFMIKDWWVNPKGELVHPKPSDDYFISGPWRKMVWEDLEAEPSY